MEGRRVRNEEWSDTWKGIEGERSNSRERVKLLFVLLFLPGFINLFLSLFGCFYCVFISLLFFLLFFFTLFHCLSSLYHFFVCVIASFFVLQ